MLPLLVILYLASALLPLAGLGLLYRQAKADAATLQHITPRADGRGSRNESDAIVGPLARQLRGRPKAVLVDFSLIGVGVIAGAVASIWSLFL